MDCKNALFGMFFDITGYQILSFRTAIQKLLQSSGSICAESTLCVSVFRFVIIHKPMDHPKWETGLSKNNYSCYCARIEKTRKSFCYLQSLQTTPPNMNLLAVSHSRLTFSGSPGSPLDLLSSLPDDYVHSVKQWQIMLKTPSEDDQFANKRAQARYTAYNSQHYRPHRHEVGDGISLDQKYFADTNKVLHPLWRLDARGFCHFLKT